MNLKNIYTSKLRYMGPTLTYSDDENIPCQYTINTGDLVDAEININIATIYGRYDENGLWPIKKPIDVAAKYLKPIKPEPIHFDPKDDEPNKEPFSTHEFFKELFDDIGKFPFFAEKIPFGSATYYTQKKVRKHLKKVQGQSVPSKEAKEIINGGNDGHEVGGEHYKMAIEPWDYIQANGLGFDEGNIVKYASRHKQKNGAEDIRKIISYARHILKTQYGEE